MVLNRRKLCFADLTSRGRSSDGSLFYATSGHALGTECQVIFSASSRAVADVFRSDISDWISNFEKKYSRFLPESMISAVNRNAGIRSVEIDKELAGMLRLCDWYYWLTQGVFEPTLLPIEELWEKHWRIDSMLPPKKMIDAALKYVGWGDVRWSDEEIFLPKAGMQLDIGGIGKEFAVDRVMEKAQARGFRNVLVDFGRDIRVLGAPPTGGSWMIGLQDAIDPTQCSVGIGLNSHAVATSGNYARGFNLNGKRYGHIIDPRTGRPAITNCVSASIIAPTCTEAGIISTSCLVLGVRDGLELLNSCPQANGFIQTPDETLRSPGFERYELQMEGSL